VDDHQLAAWLAGMAGRLLAPLRDGALEPAHLGCVGDLTANAFIVSTLERLRPDDGLLSEESVDDPARLNARRVWIVDPLDGTAEYRAGRDDWAVHVGLSIDGAAAAGAVALPALGCCHCTGKPPALKPTREGRPIIAVSRSRPPPEGEGLAAYLDATLLAVGSAGYKAMAVLTGEADIYLHSGGQGEWDNCAPVAVATAAGLHASRLDGAPIRYNNPQPSVPDLLICRPELAADALTYLAQS
jgi:3'(2'), 5'-bisphosphate nucleotidase